MGLELLWEEDIEKPPKDDGVYSEDVRDQLLEDDEISPSEAGFMKGYDDAYV